MADRPIEPGKYDPKQTPERNATADSATIVEEFKTKGADAAYQAMQRELDPQQLSQRGVTEQQRTEYQTQLVDQLKKANILPELSIAAARDRSGKPADKGGADLQTNNQYDLAKIRAARDNATNPVDKALYSTFADKYTDLRNETRNGRSYGAVNDAVLQRHLEKTTAAAKNETFKKDVSVLATRPEVFDAIDRAGTAGRNRAGATPEKTDGKITQENIEAFDKQWNNTDEAARKTFRNGFGTQEQQDQVDRAVKALKGGLEQPGLTDNNMVEGRWNPFNANGITKDSLTAGLGGPDAVAKYKAAENKLPNGADRPTVAAAENYTDSRLQRGQGPWHVANQMLKGQEGQFQDPARAQGDLTKALQTTFKDKQGAEQLGEGRRDKVREEIRKGGNTELLNWFDKRFPQRPADAAPTTPQVQRAADYSASRIVNGQGSDAISRKLVEGQNLDEGARKVLQGIVGNKAITKVDLGSARTGTEVINPTNLEDVRKAVEAAKNTQLTEWFNKRYPKKA